MVVFKKDVLTRGSARAHQASNKMASPSSRTCPLTFEDFKGETINSGVLNGEGLCRKCNKIAADHPKVEISMNQGVCFTGVMSLCFPIIQITTQSFNIIELLPPLYISLSFSHLLSEINVQIHS
jgi:hypothetical protein